MRGPHALIEWTLLVLLLAAGALRFAPPLAADGEIQGAVPSAGGISLITWGGGLASSISVFATAQGCPMRSVWSTIDGQFVGYRPDVPPMVNARFAALFPDNNVPAGTPLLLVCDAPAQTCSEWPERESAILQRLPVMENLCLVRATSPDGVSSGCAVAGACYFSPTRVIWFLHGAPVGGERASLVHEICHAHQDWVARQAEPETSLLAGIPWLETDEGKAFAAVSVSARSADGQPPPGIAGPWGENLSEDFAQVCAIWLLPDYDGDFSSYLFGTWPALAEFASDWLRPPP